MMLYSLKSSAEADLPKGKLRLKRKLTIRVNAD